MNGSLTLSPGPFGHCMTKFLAGFQLQLSMALPTSTAPYISALPKMQESAVASCWRGGLTGNTVVLAPRDFVSKPQTSAWGVNNPGDE